MTDVLTMREGRRRAPTIITISRNCLGVTKPAAARLPCAIIIRVNTRVEHIMRLYDGCLKNDIRSG